MLSDNDSDSYSVDKVASVAEQPDEALSQESPDKRKMHAKQVMSA